MPEAPRPLFSVFDGDQAKMEKKRCGDETRGTRLVRGLLSTAHCWMKGLCIGVE